MTPPRAKSKESRPGEREFEVEGGSDIVGRRDALRFEFVRSSGWRLQGSLLALVILGCGWRSTKGRECQDQVDRLFGAQTLR